MNNTYSLPKQTFNKLIFYIILYFLILCGHSFASDCDNSDNIETLIDKGTEFYFNDDFYKSYNCFIIGSKKGDGYSNGILGWMYENGAGVEQDYKKAFEARLSGASKGDAFAQGGLAWHYMMGVETELDYDLSFKWFKLAAEQGDTFGLQGLAWHYEKGNGVEQNGIEAFKLMSLAAEQNIPEAMNDLGVYYARGIGVEIDYEKAVNWYLKAAKQGNADAAGNLGFHYVMGWGVEQDYDQAYKWRLKGATQGDAYAQGGLAHQYEKGLGVEKNYDEALKWRMLASDQGDAYAMGGLAWHYLEGIAVEKDYKEAERLLKIASESEDTYSLATLGWMYENGYVSEGIDYEEAFRLRLKAAENGNEDAQAGLGWHYSEGKGIEQNYKEAVKWYRLSAEQGNAYGQASLGWHYAMGKGFEQDDELAVMWFKSAAEQGNAWAQGNLAWMYSEGLGIEKNYEEAFSWYLKGAEGGDVYSQSQTGFAYENGIGTDVDYISAYNWYSRAAQQNDEYAKEHLSGLLKKYPDLERESIGSIEKEIETETNSDYGGLYESTLNRKLTNIFGDTGTNFDYDLTPVEREATITSKTFIRTKPDVTSKRLQTADKGYIIYIAAKVKGENYFLVNDLNGIALGYIYGEHLIFEKTKDLFENLDIEWGQYYALIIANNDYINEGFQDLDTPFNDASEIERLLNKKYNFKTEILYNATEESILENIYSYRLKLEANDNLLIYYAGHGYLDESNNVGYWQPVDAELNKSWTWISNQIISDELKAMKAKHILVIADSCYSGTFIHRSIIGEEKPKDDKNIKIFYEKKNNKKARLALTSGDYQPVPDSLDGKHSPFAKALITVLGQNNEILLSSELYQMIEKQLALDSTHQEPLYGAILNSDHREGADFIFPINKL